MALPNMDAATRKLVNLGDPTADQDAATKKYVDDTAAGVTSIAKSGDTPLTGDVTLTGGTNITLTQAGQDISIASTGGSGAQGTTDSVTDLATQVAASTISNSKYNAFGIMGQLLSGDLVTVYREGTSHLSDAGVIKMRTSTDQGRTWGSATTIASEAGVDLRNVGGGVTSTGRIVVFYGRYDYTGVAWLNQGYIYSDDDGATWSTYTAVSHASDTSFSFYGQMIQIGADTLLQGWYGDDGTNYKQRVVLSTDNGATWGSAIVVANSTTVHYQEGGLAYLGGSHIVALMRDGAGTTFRQALSTDNGASWSSQGTTSFDSWSTPSPPSLVAYRNPNGKREVACYYTNRTALKTRVVYATADSLIAGTAGWSTYTDLTTPADADSGYAAVCHPLGSPSGVGWTYSRQSLSVADMVFFVATGPSAAVTESDLSLSDVTTDDVTSTKHGFAPKSPADATKFLNGAATPAYAQVKDSDLSTSDITTNDSSTSKHGFLKKLDNNSAHFMRGDGSWATPSGGSTWSVLTDGNVSSPALVFAAGDVIMVQS